MKKLIILFCAGIVALSGTFFADTGKLYDYQNYNHGYCPECSCYPCECECQPEDAPCPCPPSCDPCASVCGTDCGISMCALGIGLAALAVAGVIIVSSGNGSTGHAN